MKKLYNSINGKNQDEKIKLFLLRIILLGLHIEIIEYNY